jgi:cell fate regulator YaaT (PSP1 superfamily)
MNLARVRTPEYALFFCRVGNGTDICLGQEYAVEFDYGMDHAELIEFGALQELYDDLKIPGFRLARPLNEQDRSCIAINRELAETIRREFAKELDANRYDAKVVHGRVSLDQRRIFLRYYARTPLNLQHLIAPLEERYQATVNLWQIGLREETRLVGCIGHCGREACCCSWMKHDCQVNLKMAKNQGVPLNPAALNGTCNRLKCCFRFESEVYDEAAAKLPKLGLTVVCESQDNFEGIIINRDILRGRLVLRSRSGRFLTVDAADAAVKDEGVTG